MNAFIIKNLSSHETEEVTLEELSERPRRPEFSSDDKYLQWRKAETTNHAFYSLVEAQVLIEAWRRHYNTERPHSSLGYRPPAPETIGAPRWPSGSATLRLPASVAHGVRIH